MIIRMKARYGFEKEPCIFPANTYEIPGYSRDHTERVDILEKYAQEQIKSLNLQNEEPVELYAGGQNFALVAILNVFSDMNRPVIVSYRNCKTGLFHGQYLEPAEKIQIDIEKEVQLKQAENRHRHPRINGLEGIYSQEIEEELLFNFSALEQIAEKKLLSIDASVIRLYVTGLSQCLVSVIKVCRKLRKKLIIMHYNPDTEDHFEQICE